MSAVNPPVAALPLSVTRKSTSMPKDPKPKTSIPAASVTPDADDEPAVGDGVALGEGPRAG